MCELTSTFFVGVPSFPTANGGLGFETQMKTGERSRLLLILVECFLFIEYGDEPCYPVVHYSPAIAA